MTLTAAPQPGSTPPRVRLQMTAPDGGTFTALEVSRDGVPLRAQPYAGSADALLDDYEAPFGAPITYNAEGAYLPATAPDWTETWSSLGSWTGDTASWTVTSGRARATAPGVQLTRGTTGEIQKVAVTAPTLVRIELLSATDVVVASVRVELSKVTLVSGASSVQASGSGSFSIVLSGGTVTASAESGEWSLARPYSGAPVKVRVVALGQQWVNGASLSTPHFYALTAGPSGTIFAGSVSSDGMRATAVRFGPGVTVPTEVAANIGTPLDLSVDSAGNLYVADDSNAIVKYNSAGAQVASWSTGTAPMAVAVRGSEVYVATSTPGPRIKVYDTAGTFLRDWAVATRAVDLDVDSSGNAYALINNSGTREVRKYSSTGTLLTSWTVPQSVDVTVNGSVVYVVEGSNVSPRVRMYSLDGSSLGSWAAINGHYAEGLAIATDGRIYLGASTTSYESGVLREVIPTASSVGALEATPTTTPQPYAASVSTTLYVDEPWLIHPSLPDLSVSIGTDDLFMESGTRSQSRASARRNIHQPIGRRRAVVTTSGPRAAADWTLVLIARTRAAQSALEDLLDDQTPLLLRSSALDDEADLPDGWYSLGDISVERMPNAEWLPDRITSMPMTPVDEPVLIPGSTWTWADIALEYSAWQELMDTYDSWLDVMAGPSN